VSPACDLDIIVRVASDHPTASVVLVGPVSIDTTRLNLPNVHLFGAQPYADLPAWVQAFDAGIIPYVLNDWTRAVDPLKLLEYLAAGIPVVATPLPEVAKYSEVVRVAGGAGEFSEAVAEVVRAPETAGSERAERQAFARKHTWEVRAARFLAIAEEVEAARRGIHASPDATGAAAGIQA
jgi:glycosyltransferase involved in cell wall biosynthesis